MITPPKLTTPEQERQDSDHLKLLSIFHFIFGTLALAGILFLVFHFVMMSALMSPEFWKGQKNPPPAGMVNLFAIFYVFGGVILVLGSVLNGLSGMFLRKRRHRMSSMVVAGLNCVQVPLGTALGVFTIMVLSRESVRQIYERSARPEVNV